MHADVLRWLAFADIDIRTIRNSVYGPEPSFEAASYHCQQAAEKIVKAALALAGVEPPKIHNIKVLVNLLPASDKLRPVLQGLRA
jgi:HEPN domain-containing protein